MSDLPPGGTLFNVEINGGETLSLLTRTDDFGLAAVASLALLPYEPHLDYQVVKIWRAQNGAPAEGPYWYAVSRVSAGIPEDHRKW